MARIAVTGGTGFIGRQLLPKLVAAGHQVGALTRQPQPDMPGVMWVRGHLADTAALRKLVAPADAVIHLAGVIKARDPAKFQSGNVEATQALAWMLRETGRSRLIHISSLAAREPSLSPYAQSKAHAEAVVRRSGLDWTILRPPGVYGPGDKETLRLFKAAKGPLMPLSNPDGQVSVIHVHDLCDAILAAMDPATVNKTLEVSDGGVLTLRALAEAIRSAVGGTARIVPLGEGLVTWIARVNAAWSNLTRAEPMLTPAKVRELYHHDWAITDNGLTSLTDWAPKIPLAEGLKATADWYRTQRWI
jgi:nucleoside-diphosphate-sugar epimerase